MKASSERPGDVAWADTMMDQLPCPGCGSRYDPTAILDHCSVSWPQQLWLWFDCPACVHGSHIEVAGERLSIGGIDGAPGPCFFADATIEVPGLRAKRIGWAVVVNCGEREWRVRARR